MQGKVVLLTGNKRAGKTTLANKLNKEYNFYPYKYGSNFRCRRLCL